MLAGNVLGDASWAPPPSESFARTAAREPGRLRIAFTTVAPLVDAELDPVCARATRDAAALLESLGHDVEEVRPPWQVPGLLKLFTHAFGPAVCATIGGAALLAGREPREDDVEPLSWALWQKSKRIDSVRAMLAGYALQRLARTIVTWANRYDALLTPALARPPVPIGTLDPCGPDPIGTFERSAHFTPYAAICNVTGSPAVSLPLYEHDGLPLAVQLMGRPAQEGALLALAAQVEAAAPWAHRRPPLAVEAPAR